MARAQSQGTQGANALVAGLLREKAAVLEAQNANPFRINAYRQAAETIAGMTSDVGELFHQSGIEGLIALPHIGEGIAGAIAEILLTGRWSQLERLRGTLDPVAVFRAIPGVGPDLARQIHDTLHVDTLEALEAACNDGSIETVPGIGKRRAASIRAALAQLLSQRRVRGLRSGVRQGQNEPPVGLLLEVDREYREKAA
jgi:DNA polymerase/3'-5' exonuclease PolX